MRLNTRPVPVMLIGTAGRGGFGDGSAVSGAALSTALGPCDFVGDVPQPDTSSLWIAPIRNADAMPSAPVRPLEGIITHGGAHGHVHSISGPDGAGGTSQVLTHAPPPYALDSAIQDLTTDEAGDVLMQSDAAGLPAGVGVMKPTCKMVDYKSRSLCSNPATRAAKTLCGMHDKRLARLKRDETRKDRRPTVCALHEYYCSLGKGATITIRGAVLQFGPRGPCPCAVRTVRGDADGPHTCMVPMLRQIRHKATNARASAAKQAVRVELGLHVDTGTLRSTAASPLLLPTDFADTTSFVLRVRTPDGWRIVTKPFAAQPGHLVLTDFHLDGIVQAGTYEAVAQPLGEDGVAFGSGQRLELPIHTR